MSGSRAPVVLSLLSLPCLAVFLQLLLWVVEPSLPRGRAVLPGSIAMARLGRTVGVFAVGML